MAGQQQTVHPQQTNKAGYDALNTEQTENVEDIKEHTHRSSISVILRSPQEDNQISELIGSHITFKHISDNDDYTTYEIQSIQMKSMDKHEEYIIPDLVKDSTNEWLLYDAITKNNLVDFLIAVFIILLQLTVYIILAYRLITEYDEEAENRESACYGPNCHVKEQNCMKISVGFISAIILVGYVWADIINTYPMIKDSIKCCKVEKKKK
eukprot:159441_1